MSGNDILINIYALILSMGPGLPLLMALACSLPLLRKSIRFLFPWAAVPALLTTLIVPVDKVVQVPWFFMGGRMGLDENGQVFLCTASFVWLLASLSTLDLLRNDPRSSRFMGYFLAAMAGNIGLLLAQDMLGFYLFFALMSFAAYGLVVHYESDEARSAGRVYLTMVILGEVAMFTALTLLSYADNSIAIADLTWTSLHPATLILLFIGFGVKVAALPLHFWMPPAYQSAPLPAATALAGAMVNAGLLGWLRFLPLGQMALPAGALLFVTVGSCSALVGIVLGLGQKRAAAVLAYSSISQMGLMTMIVGIGLMDPDSGRHAVFLLTMFAVHHSMAKSSLFLGIQGALGRNGKVSGRMTAGLLLPALALAGLPLTSGAIVKTGFKELSAFTGGTLYDFCRIFLPLASIGTTILVLHFIRLLLRAQSAETEPAPWTRIAWIISLTAVAAALWLLPGARISASHSLVMGKIWQSLWPVAAGVLLVLLWSSASRNRDTPYVIPAADILALVLSWARCDLLHCWDQMPGKLRNGSWLPQRLLIPRISSFLTNIPWRKAEKVLGRWSVAGLSYLALCILLLFLLL